MKRVTTAEMVKARKKTLAEIEAFKTKALAKLQPLFDRYINDNCPFKIGKVYEPLKGTTKPRGFNRFVVYTRDVQFFSNGGAIIYIAGWFLDANNVPTKWHQYAVGGTLANPSQLTISENQKNEKHPDSTKK